MTARILVVDDIAPNIKLLEAKLKAEYFEVLTATDGEAALRIAKREAPDLILLDVMMPGMDGFEVCRQLRAHPKTRHLPVVMVTALTDVADRVRGLEAGADDFLSKPLNEIVLFARVRSLVRLKTLMDELRARQATAGEEWGEPSDSFEAMPAGGNILLVDANERNADRVRETLTEAGYRLMLASDIQDGLKIGLGMTELDLVIVALNVDGEDGLSLCGQLRSQENTRHVPILLTLEDFDLPRLAKGLDVGVTDYLLTPIDKNELLARTRTQMRRRRYHNQLRSVLDRNMSMAFTDGLTGIYNRRYMAAHLERKLMEIAASGKPVSVMLFDIDHFKGVNDRYGHAAGDTVLRCVAERAAAKVRNFDLVARYGGEEFAVIMPDTPEELAWMVAERLRIAIQSDPVAAAPGVALAVTISAGVASTADPSESGESILERADAALYAAKGGGRNRVMSWRMPPLRASAGGD
jgi:two-component system cell cycle response regulator